MIILFPSEPFISPLEIESAFREEYEAAKLVGFKTYLFDHDEFVKDNILKTNIPINQKEEHIILRGWMLKEEQYDYLYGSLLSRGYFLINKSKQYLSCHHLPEAYKYISEHTQKIWWSNYWLNHPGFNNTRSVSWAPVRNMLGGDIIIKDYVKSEKSNPDLFILKKELSNDEFSDKVQAFIDARGKLFNKGLVFKEVIPLKKYGGQTNEWRFFFFNNDLIIYNQNSDCSLDNPVVGEDQVELLKKIAKNIPSNFFTIDIAEKEDGSWVILETGDGQVSGLPLGGSIIAFYNLLNNKLQSIEV